jgi:hypothetical protein
MIVVAIKKERLEALRDAMLDKLLARIANEDGTLDYRAVHYEVHVFVDAIVKES